MKHGIHSTTNDALLPEEGTEADVDTLRITRGVTRIGDGDVHVSCVASYWYPSQEEIDRIVAGMPIQLCVIGRTHPPLSVDVATTL